MTPDQASEFVHKLMETYLTKAAKVHFEPYVKMIGEGIHRGMNLVSQAGKGDKEIASEILRAVVVLNHAYLEDFLRNVALWLMPIAGEDALNKIPLAGPTGRAEKFHLGKLAEHRGKKVDDVIRESVEAHMERSTFNNVTEIMSFLDSVNVNLPRSDEIDASSSGIPRLPISRDSLGVLDAMMKRRHHIVHRADRAKAGDGLEEITETEVMLWLATTMMFTLSIATENFMQRHSQEQFQKTVEEWAMASAKTRALKPSSEG